MVKVPITPRGDGIIIGSGGVLDLPVRLHDPGQYYCDADGRWIGWSTGGED